MAKVIRPTYPMEVSIGLILLIFVISFFLSHQVFAVSVLDLNEQRYVYFGMFLVSSAVVIMMLVLWEEFLFPIHVKPEDGAIVFRNHRHKLIQQSLIYLAIPAIFIFIYAEFEINHVRFFIWAAICILSPIVGKLFSGLKNYNDFLDLSQDSIAYKNNEKEGAYALKDIRQIKPVRDEGKVLHKIQLILTDGTNVIIDLDEMELDDFYVEIDKFLSTRYKAVL